MDTLKIAFCDDGLLFKHQAQDAVKKCCKTIMLSIASPYFKQEKSIMKKPPKDDRKGINIDKKA